MNAHAATRSLLLLTWIAVSLETCLLVVAVMGPAPTWFAPALLAFFHMGYLLAHVPILRSSVLIGRTALLVALTAISAVFQVGSLSALAIGALLASAVIQLARKRLKPHAKVPTVQKHLAKTLGMLSGFVALLPPAGLGAAWLVVAILLAALVVVPPFASAGATFHRTSEPHPTVRRLLATELAHHCHYFVYCYAIWSGFAEPLRRWLPALLIVGWLAYFAFEKYLAANRSCNDLRVVSIGHSLGAAVLGFAALEYPAAIPVLICWFLTGFTGGTAYVLSNVHSDPRRELFEDIGHVFGCATSALILALGGSPALTLAAGAALSALTGLLAWQAKTNRLGDPNEDRNY